MPRPMKYVSLHKCPVCDGTSHVPAGFYDSTYIDEYGNRMGSTTTATPETCRSCEGRGYLSIGCDIGIKIPDLEWSETEDVPEFGWVMPRPKPNIFKRFVLWLKREKFMVGRNMPIDHTGEKVYEFFVRRGNKMSIVENISDDTGIPKREIYKYIKKHKSCFKEAYDSEGPLDAYTMNMTICDKIFREPHRPTQLPPG